LGTLKLYTHQYLLVVLSLKNWIVADLSIHIGEHGL